MVLSTAERSPATLRRLPYPYAGAIAICSDLDETPDRDVYWGTTRYLNTTATTPMGPGLGLEVGNSIYFDMDPRQFAYWNTDDRGRAMVRALVASGHIDVIHSYGDLATSRAHAHRALGELEKHGCRLEVWVDHSKAPTNFGPDIMFGHGDEVGSPAYHADLTAAYGIKYLSMGRVTSVIGQDVDPSFGGVFSLAHPAGSGKTLAKEVVKHVLARRGNLKYGIHPPNRALRVVRLRDGRPIFEFLRCNPGWGGVSFGDTATGVAEVMTERFLGRLVAREGVCIYYTHLGKVHDRQQPLPPGSREALGRLARYSREKKLLVTTTQRLLRYLAVRDHLRFQAMEGDGGCAVRLESVEDPVSGPRPPSPTEVQGLTFVSAARRLTVSGTDGTSIECESVRVGDATYATIPWRPLLFPEAAL